MHRDSPESAVGWPFSDEDTDDTDETRLDASTAFDLLASRRRRLVVSALRRDDGTSRGEDGASREDKASRGDSWVSLTPLAERVAATEEGTTPDGVASETRRDCRRSLHHVHLPKLADAGLVEYDAVDNRARPTADLDEFAERL